MPNKNYLAGRRMEYARAKAWRDDGWDVMRTAGSHGAFDLVCTQYDKVLFIQCKVTKSKSVAKKLLKDFEAAPPLFPCLDWRQRMEVKVVGSSEILGVTV
jgi:hypothetical protein